MKKTLSNNTIARFPDFIIGGAPKCGTTSIHFILGQHPDVGIPDNEILFYDADDPIVHPDFLHTTKGKLAWFDPVSSPDALTWYQSRFAPFANKKMIGEDSPTYLFSDVAPARIAARAPGTKLIFTLRNPVARTYSQYWHLMMSGRATASFEDSLITQTSLLLGSTYTPHLERFSDHHGRENIHVVIFEDFLKDPQAVTSGLTDFLGLAPFDFDETTQFNKTNYPRNHTAQRLVNRIGSRVVAGRYRNHMEQDETSWRRIANKFHYRWFKYINPIFLGADKAPPMRSDTKAFLQQHLSARNAGLSRFLDRDISEVWPGLSV